MPGIAVHSPYSQPLGSPGGRQLDLEFISSFLLDAAVSYPNCLVQGSTLFFEHSSYTNFFSKIKLNQLYLAKESPLQ